MDATELVRIRTNLKADTQTEVVPSYNVLIAALTARALVEHPALNATLDGKDILYWEAVNIGIAVDTPRGLVVPVSWCLFSRPGPGGSARLPEKLLDKRVKYKRLMAMATQPAARAALDQRQTALKWLLVVSFGYLGYKNARFGRIEAHESVTAYSRELLLQAKEVAEQQGYRLLHAIVDSLWLVKPGPVRTDYDRLAHAITERTGLSIGVEGVYHWIGFLPSRVNPLMPVPNQFVGLFDHGAMKIRGIEIRRSDAPPLVRRAQAEMLRCLSQGRTLVELRERIPQALETIRAYRRYLQDGLATVEELAITKSLAKKPQAYRHQTLSMIAAQELLARGVPLQAGDRIHYIITFGPATRAVIETLHGDAFREALEALTGETGLLPDPALDGSGLHLTEDGGYLNVHADHLSHTTHRTWSRRVNLLLFLNRGWQPAWGGQLELWSPDMRRCVVRIEPGFNRCVIFPVSRTTYHGVVPVRCPSGRSRRSIALYYFRDEGHTCRLRPTKYVARPGDSPVKRVAILLDRWAVAAYSALKRYTPLDDATVSRLLRRF